uniref:Uncharacterized protein n=1 Tax=Trichogramma kaykai TaxID=54128 RepID=A0ABD2W8L3_9HYME
MYGAESRDITMDVFQRSVPSSILWNGMNNKILKFKLLDTMYVVGFANDIALTVVNKQLENVKNDAKKGNRLVRVNPSQLGLANH